MWRVFQICMILRILLYIGVEYIRAICLNGKSSGLFVHELTKRLHDCMYAYAHSFGFRAYERAREKERKREGETERASETQIERML